jgi:hypothetical protein
MVIFVFIENASVLIDYLFIHHEMISVFVRELFKIPKNFHYMLLQSPMVRDFDTIQGIQEKKND